jgi:hypothetical protein
VQKLNSFKYNIWKEFEPKASAGELPDGEFRPQRDNFELLPNHETPNFTPEKHQKKMSALPNKDDGYKGGRYLQDWTEKFGRKSRTGLGSK